MKNKIKIFGIIALTAVIMLSVAACGGDDDNGGKKDDIQQLSATGATFDGVVKGILTKPGNYVINLTGNLTDYPGASLNTAGVNITIKGTGNNRIIWKNDEEDYRPLFTVNAGKLSFEDIRLSRSEGNTAGELLRVVDGTLEMKKGAVLSNYHGSDYFDGIVLDSGSFIMSSGTIEKCGYGISVRGYNNEIIISDGTIKDNAFSGISAWGESGIENFKLIISGGTISGNKGHGVDIGNANATITMSGGAIKDNDKYGFCIWDADQDKNCTLTISGGTISGNGFGDGSNVDFFPNGVGVGAANTTITMTGGTIKNNDMYGFCIWDEDQDKNCTLTISGGTISGNGFGDGSNVDFFPNGVGVGAANTTITMTGGTIKDNNGTGLCIWNEPENGTLTISGGTISDNLLGVYVGSANATITMSGGTIKNNGEWGVGVGDTVENCTFEKKVGAVIYGNTGANANEHGAIVFWKQNADIYLERTSDADINIVYAVEIENRTIVPGSQKPVSWDVP